MAITYLDKVQYLHPGIQHVMYWHDKNPEADFDDPYDRLLWENKDFPKPSKEELDSISDELILTKIDTDTKEQAQVEAQVKLDMDLILSNLVDILISKNIITSKDELLEIKAQINSVK